MFRHRSLTLPVVLATLSWSSCVGHPPGERVAMETVVGRSPVDGLGGRPFVVSPDGRFLAFSYSTDEPAAANLSSSEGSVSSLETVRILDLDTRALRSPDVARSAHRLLESGYGAIPHLRCWDRSGPVLHMRTTGRRWLELDVREPQLAWRASEGSGRTPSCPDREIPRPPVRLGDYEVRATDSGGLRVLHGQNRRVAFASDPSPLRTHLLRQLALSPDGRHLGVVYSASIGSFTGPYRSVVVSLTTSGDIEVRRLEPDARYLAWHPGGGTLFGYGPSADGEGFGIFRVAVEG